MPIDVSTDQPIAALGSPPGGAARGIVRISGAEVRGILTEWFHPDDPSEWQAARRARSHRGQLVLQGDSRELRVPVQVLLWPGRKSYTGQPLMELHLPGSPALLEAVLSEIYQRGARAARPGEFTLRAFLAGKLDLLQAEAVLGVIDAQDHVELKTALTQLAGGVSGKLAHIRRDLLELLADLEAGLDFIEEDIEFVGRDEVVQRLAAASQFIDDLMQQATDRMRSRVHSQVVLAGLPNAGKSTLFNFLAGADNALVSPEQGTTRDFLIRAVAWEGLEFDLIDTAGWEQTSDGIAAAAQRQRMEQLDRADLLLWCSAAGLADQEQTLDDRLFQEAAKRAPAAIRLRTKMDLIADASAQADVSKVGVAVADAVQDVHLSVKAESGLTELGAQLRQRLVHQSRSGTEWLGMTAARCRETLMSVTRALQRAESAAQTRQVGDELIAVDVRAALEELGVILGVIYTDDILDRVFSKFCIGK